MHKNYLLDDHVMNNIIQRYIKPTEQPNEKKIINYYIKSKTSHLIV